MGVLLNLLGRVVQRLKEIPQRGLPSLHTTPSGIDREFHVSTGGIVWLTNPFSRNFAHGFRYEACNPDACRWVIDNARINPCEFWFVDIGCGKGRALIVASTYPFPRLIGADYSARLCRIARKNLIRCGIPRSRWEVICADATEYGFPPQNLFVYFSNPFDAHILDAVVKHLEKHPAKLVIGFEGKGRMLLRQCAWLRHLDSGPNVELYTRDVHSYEANTIGVPDGI